ncbi:hypothetical protein [Desulfolutivibrio sulfodismutans]|uniref:hypothetical protein n=1 Tax=Desulfolutivibrio sulfodismutans TaxID=63561 RepID=UPI00159E8E99|nr:hypothetical protein [Desulfolutivibrio sulfodismutans]
MNPSSLSLPDVLVLFGCFTVTALVFLLMGWRFGRESAGRAMFEHALPASPGEAAVADEADPWDAAMHGCPALEPAAADACPGNAMPFFASRGHSAQVGDQDGRPTGG